MSRDRSKEQTWYEVRIYFKHGTKDYKLTTVKALEEFFHKADENDTVIHYMVQSVSKFVYPNWQSSKFKLFEAD